MNGSEFMDCIKRKINMLAANVYHDDEENRGVIEVLVPSIEKDRPKVQIWHCSLTWEIEH